MATATVFKRISGLNRYLQSWEMTGNGYAKVALWALLNILISSLALGWSITLTWEHQTWRSISYPACVHKVKTVLLLNHGR